MTCVSRKTCR